MGAHRAVVVSDFEILQELLNKPETADRQGMAPEVVGKIQFSENNHCKSSIRSQPCIILNPKFPRLV